MISGFRKSSSFFFAVAVALGAGGKVASAETDRVARMPKEHASLFKTHCFDCHDSASEEAGVNLETLSYDVSRDMETAGLWQKVLNAINSGEMPPEDHDPIPDDQKLQFLEDLTDRMVEARKILGDTRGKIPLRRLNRREYANTIESLLGVRPDVSQLPSDQVGEGFDTQGASLFMSSDQIEQYLATARIALQQCFDAKPSSDEFVRRVEVEEQFLPKYREYFDDWAGKDKIAQAYFGQNSKKPSDFGLIDEYQAKSYANIFETHGPILRWYFDQPENKTGGAMIMVPKNMGMARIKMPSTPARSPGRYRVRVRAGTYAQSEPRYRYLEFSNLATAKQRDYLGCRFVSASLESPEIIEFEFDQKPGQSHQLVIHQRTHQDRADKALWTAKRKENGFGLHPGVWADWAEIELIEPSDQVIEAKSKILGQLNRRRETEFVTDVLKRFSRRAFRGRQPTGEYLQRIEAIYQELRTEGFSMDEALIESLAIVLSSPEFLYMVNEGESDSDRLKTTELANRLAYLLWSEPADETLMSLARNGQLSSPEVLRQETNRLLEDPRSERFVRDFTHQWLQLDRLGMFQFNGLQFPTFDNAIREEGRNEIFETVGMVMREKIPLGALLKSEFVVVNDLLAEYYDIPEVQGHQFRRVKVEPNSVRGGLLGTVAVNAMGSDGLRTSPVERGAWVLRHLLHDPPAPAPPNVPQLSRLDGEIVSAREIQKLHQEQPQCAQCHRKIDPVGFGLENFSADGLWRDVEVIKYGNRNSKSKSFEIDPQGRLPSGETFSGFLELRSAIAKKDTEFARGFVEELIAYALGRPYGFTDETLVDSILNQTQENGFAITEIVHLLVQSETFQSK
ncbi:MAG: DUF1592 domain-containing protein [Planctomycetota bacterium]